MGKRGTVPAIQCLQNLMFVLSEENPDCLISCEMFMGAEASVIQNVTMWTSDPRGLLLAEITSEDVFLCKIFQKGSLLAKINLEMLSKKDCANMS